MARTTTQVGMLGGATTNSISANSSGLFLIANTGLTVNSSGVFASGGIGASIYLLDSISASFNGVTNTFNLTSGAAPITPIANQYLFVILGGVFQAPSLAYSVSGNSVQFATPPSAGETCSMMVMTTVSPATPGQITLIDSIAASFNGSTTTFNLLSGGNAITPGAPQNLAVVLGGVHQDPSSSYTVSGNSITFSSAPANNEPCFIVMMGSTSNGTIAGANTQIIYNASGAYAGDPNLTWNNSTDVLTIGNSSVNTVVNSTTISMSGMLLPSAYSFRNRVINGDMRIDQRNSGAVYTSANGTLNYVLDRFFVWQSGNTMDVQQVSSYATTPNPYALQLTGKASINSVTIGHRIESKNIYDTVGSTVTFQLKMSSTSLTNVSWGAVYPTALDNWAAETNFANGYFTINTTPTIYTTSFTVNAGCANGMMVKIQPVANLTTGTLTTTDWQVELGSVATPFERRSPAVEFPLCYRYFYSNPDNVRTWIRVNLDGARYYGWAFPATMARTPSLTANYSGEWAGSNTGTFPNGNSSWYENTIRAAQLQFIVNASVVVNFSDFKANAEIY